MGEYATARNQEQTLSDWELVKRRTAASGAVWRSADNLFYKRTGDESVREEADFQVDLARRGYPVPQVTERGLNDGTYYFVEASAGVSLHDQALASADPSGQVYNGLVRSAVQISTRLLEAQSRNPLTDSSDDPRAWFERAGFVANVRAENPDLDTPRVREAIGRAVRRLQDVPMCRSHLDYGLPNAFPRAVIDWQHHGDAPLGYDVYPMLDIAAFKGGGKGYRFRTEQRSAYLNQLDEASASLLGRPLSEYQGDFLLVKCFFFLALMRPTDPGRRDKYDKWQYRRALFEIGLEQYESSCSINTEAFPSLADFSHGLDQAVTGRPRP
ncbi:MAG TPA: phosphotransferase [Streptosporangiaceae bacterium]